MAYNDSKATYQPPTSAPHQTFEPQSQVAADAYAQREGHSYGATGHTAPGGGGGTWQYDGPRGPAGAGVGGSVGNQGPGGVYVVDQPRHSTDCKWEVGFWMTRREGS